MILSAYLTDRHGSTSRYILELPKLLWCLCSRSNNFSCSSFLAPILPVFPWLSIKFHHDLAFFWRTLSEHRQNWGQLDISVLKNCYVRLGKKRWPSLGKMNLNWALQVYSSLYFVSGLTYVLYLLESLLFGQLAERKAIKYKTIKSS